MHAWATVLLQLSTPLLLHNNNTFEWGQWWKPQVLQQSESLHFQIWFCAPQTAVILSLLSLFFCCFPAWALLYNGHSGCSITTSSKNLKYLALVSRQTGWKEERDAHEPLPAARGLLESGTMNHGESGENTPASGSRFNILLNASKVFSTLGSDPWLRLESLIITRFQMERNHLTHSGCMLLRTLGHVGNILPIWPSTVQTVG